MNRIDNSQRVAAKVAGVSGLLAVVIVVVGNYALFGPLVVPGNAAETARNIVAHQTQVRVALTCFLIYSANVVVLLTALYVILKPVDRILALLGALFRLVFALLWLLAPLNLLGALRLLGSAAYLQMFEADRLQALARLQIAANFDDYYLGLPFFGLATDLGPVAAWGLELDQNRIRVDPASCAASLPGIFAIGDIASYPGKLKLILSGFAEAALAAHAIHPLVHPGEALHFEYSTTKGVPGR